MRQFEESRLVKAAGELWTQATQAEFLRAAAAGTLPASAFNRWLVQDYLFARGLTSFQAIATAKTPREFHKPLIAGLSAMDLEMDWFEAHAVQRGLDLGSATHPVCRRYTDFLIAAAYAQPFEVLLAILYGVEVSYLVAWSAWPAKGPYAEFIERWSNERFVAYVGQLLEISNENPHPADQGYFNEVLRHERDFWRMTWEG